VTIGQAGIGTQLTNSFVSMAYAMLVAIGLVYLIVVILVCLLLVPMVILFALPLVVSVVTNAIVLHKARGWEERLQGNSYGATRRARRHRPRIFTTFSRALHAIFTPALVYWQFDTTMSGGTSSGRPVCSTSS
jgi:hypothetical protein